MWQEPAVKVGDTVNKNQLIAKGITKINFQANVNIFVFFVLLLGISWGLGMGAVYKFIPMYFPNTVGVVGGTVGVLGGLGGFLVQYCSATCWSLQVYGRAVGYLYFTFTRLPNLDAVNY